MSVGSEQLIRLDNPPAWHPMISWMAMAISIIVAIAPPVFYTGLSYRYEQASLTIEAEINGRQISGLINKNPEMWQFEYMRLQELLAHRPREGNWREYRQVFNQAGTLVAENKDTLAPPIIAKTAKIFDAGNVVGIIKISRSMRPIIYQSLLIGLISLLCGTILYFAMRALLAKLDFMHEEKQRAEAILRKSEWMLRSVASGTTAVGEEFFRSLVHQLTLALGMKYAFVGELIEPLNQRVRTISIWADSSFADNFEYSLQGTPCANVINQRICLYPRGVAALFPDDKMLAQMGVESYLGIPMFNSQHQPLGLLVVLDDKPLSENAATESILGIFAARAGAEVERMRSERHILYMAHHDALTGLPNRNLLLDRIEQALIRLQRRNGQAAVLFIDLDHFKIINDSLGHEIGDLLLKEVASRIMSSIRHEDTVARQGGDEFIVLLPDVPHAHEAGAMGEKLLNVLMQPYQIKGKELYTSASIGIAVFPEDGTDVNTLLKNSDTAMYHAKQAGRNNYQFYAGQMNQLAAERQSLSTYLHHAIERDELLIHFQPIVNMASGKLACMEALLRWQHPEQGLIPPLRFITLAEESGLIVPIGTWVLRAVCKQICAWQNQGYEVPRVAINLSAHQFRQKSLLTTITDILSETSVEAHHIGFEITESTLIENILEVAETLRTLSAMGFEISIDDFGTGYSSLSYLKRFHIDNLKIDKSFVQDITTDPDDAAIVKAIIVLAHSLQMQVIAEGVETEEQLAFLKTEGCEQYQGYYFSKPLPAEKLVTMLERRTEARVRLL